jgi:predicted kinase
MKNKEIYIEAGSLVILSGLPGAGKSTLKDTAENFRDLDAAWLSTDDIRRQLLGAVTDLAENGELIEVLPEAANIEVFAILKLMVRARLRNGRTCIIDATSLTDADRKPFVDMAQAHGVGYKVLILGTALDDCLTANQNRTRKVPEARIREMSKTATAELKVNARGKEVAQTPAQGFMRTSAYTFETINREDRLVLRLPSLPSEDYDVVGDVHGLLNELLELVAKAGYVHKDGRLSHPQGRKLLLLGDLVDRGYDSIGVLRLVRNAVRDGVAVCIKGNHDEKLVRFVDTARRDGIERWSSLSNAETGMQLLKVADCDELVEFLRYLPPYKVLQAGEGLNLAFVHGNMKRFDAELTASGDMVYGQFGFTRGVDSDALYEERVVEELNEWTLFRGHIPQTSPQESVFSLERHPFQKGELWLVS